MKKLPFAIIFFCIFCLLTTSARASIREIEEKYINSVFVVETYFKDPRYVHEGTAFAIKSLNNNDGTHTYHFLSNAHVADYDTLEEITWQLISHNNALAFDVQLIGLDHTADVCVFSATLSDKEVTNAIGISALPAIPWGDIKTVKVQDKVISIGNTIGRGIVVHTGHVNSVKKGKRKYPFPVMQTDAATNKGNSGSPILNEKGELIAVHFQGDRTTGVLIGYEIPVDRVKKTYDNILNHKEQKAASYGYWGLTVRPMPLILQKYYFKDQPLHGVKITNVYKNSPAEKAGILAGDILLLKDKIYNDEHLYLINEKIKDSWKNPDIELEIYRYSKVIPVQLKANIRSNGRPEAFHTTHNFTVSNLTPKDIEKNKMTRAGVYVAFDNTKTTIMFDNFRRYTIVTKVNGIPTPNVKEFKAAWEAAIQDPASLIVLTVYHSSLQYRNAEGGVGNIQDVVIRK